MGQVLRTLSVEDSSVGHYSVEVRKRVQEQVAYRSGDTLEIMHEVAQVVTLHKQRY